MYIGLISIVVSVLLALGLFATDHRYMAYALNQAFAISWHCGAGSAAAVANEPVLPRMRASSFAFYLLLITFIGLALRRYTMGQISDRLAEQGADGGEALRQGLRFGLIPFGASVVLSYSPRDRSDTTRPAGSNAPARQAKPGSSAPLPWTLRVPSGRGTR